MLEGNRFVYDGIEWPASLDLTEEERGNDFYTQDYVYEAQHVTGDSPPGGTNRLGHPAIAGCQPANWPPGDAWRPRSGIGTLRRSPSSWHRTARRATG